MVFHKSDCDFCEKKRGTADLAAPAAGYAHNPINNPLHLRKGKDLVMGLFPLKLLFFCDYHPLQNPVSRIMPAPDKTFTKLA